jgi:hypothetical protein
MRRLLAAALGLMAFGLLSAARAEFMPHYTLRELATQEGPIVITSPAVGKADDAKSAKMLGDTFAISEVLRGDPKLAGTTVKLGGTESFSLTDGWFFRPEPPPVKPKRLLLFLVPIPKGGWQVRSAWAETVDGKFLRPIENMSQNGYALIQPVNLKWDDAIERLRRFLPQVEEAWALEHIKDTAERNQKIFAWLRRHEGEYRIHMYRNGSGHSEEPDTGWFFLPHDMLKWVAKGGRILDTWQAIQMVPEVSTFKMDIWNLEGSASTFASEEGREFLLRKLVDDGQPVIARRSAAMHLHHALNAYASFPGGLVSPEKQEAILRELMPLVNCEDRRLRHEGISLLLSASERPQPNKLAYATIGKALLAEQEGDILPYAVPALNRLMSAEEWQALTGNPARICVVPNGHCAEDLLRINVNSQHLPEGARLPVEVLMERRNENGEVLERIEMEAKPRDSQSWPKDGSFQLEPLNARGMTHGRWWAWLEGISADQNQHAWKSWHMCFDVR